MEQEPEIYTFVVDCAIEDKSKCKTKISSIIKDHRHKNAAVYDGIPHKDNPDAVNGDLIVQLMGTAKEADHMSKDFQSLKPTYISKYEIF
jgi:hypothetical protein